MNFKPNVGDVFLNKYEILSLVGEGAFGSVYRARDTKLDRIVAIKFINATNTTIDRFTDELDAIKGLDHPNIVRLYDYDILRGGIPCMVMEFINGREIGDILAEKGHFELYYITEIAQQVLDALVETHKQNIIHCDLKPENIMLTNVGARDNVVKLIDFGIASLLHKDEEDDERSKLLVGTPQYMAPEQITHGEIGPWTDIYAFGLIMIELFTGEFVFDDEDPREVLRMQLHSPIILPHKLACSELGPIISRATQKEISKRYLTTREFYNDICDALQSMRDSQSKLGKSEGRDRAMSAILDDLEDFGIISPNTASSESSANRYDEEPLSQSQLRAIAEKKENIDLGNLAQSISLTQDSLKEMASIAPPSDDFTTLPPSPSSTSSIRPASQPRLQASSSSSFATTSPEKKKTRLTPELTARRKEEKPKKSATGVIITIAVLLLCGILGYAGVKHFGLIGSENDDVKVSAETPKIQLPKETKDVFLYSAQKTTAETMALAAALPAGYGVSKDIAKYTPYRIIGTPTTAAVFVDDAIACHKTPCTVNIFGDPTKVHLELRKDKKVMKFSLADRDPKDKIIVVLK